MLTQLLKLNQHSLLHCRKMQWQIRLDQFKLGTTISRLEREVETVRTILLMTRQHGCQWWWNALACQVRGNSCSITWKGTPWIRWHQLHGGEMKQLYENDFQSHRCLQMYSWQLCMVPLQLPADCIHGRQLERLIHAAQLLYQVCHVHWLHKQKWMLNWHSHCWHHKQQQTLQRVMNASMLTISSTCVL